MLITFLHYAALIIISPLPMPFTFRYARFTLPADVTLTLLIIFATPLSIFTITLICRHTPPLYAAVDKSDAFIGFLPLADYLLRRFDGAGYAFRHALMPLLLLLLPFLHVTPFSLTRFHAIR